MSWDPHREEAELKAYLGDAFDRARLEQHDAYLDSEAAQVGDEGVFYRTTDAYLYDLTVFAMSGTKLPYLELLTSHVPPGSRVLDYGCGIGSDGLLLLEAGYRVEFADFDNPSIRYLKWRLEHRGLDAPIHDLDRDVPGGFAAAYAFDVIEHVKDPFAFLRELEARSEIVEVNFLEYEPHEQLLHYELPVGRLLRHVSRHELIAYSVMHGSSHVVVYGTREAGGLQLARSAAVLAGGAVRHQAARLPGLRHRGRATRTA